MTEDINEVKSIIFGIFSPEEIINMSVCKLDNTKLSGKGSVYDERMGSSIDSNGECVTCNKSTKLCSGHFGYIELNEPIIHPLFYKNVVTFLRCFCIECSRLLITKDQVVISDINRYKKENRFKKIVAKLEKVDICCHCNHPQPKITYSTTDNIISMTYKDKFSSKIKDVKSNDSKISIELVVNDIKKKFDMIKNEDVILCGFNPDRIHPKNLIMSVFPVIPPCARPFVFVDDNICDDDLTNQIIEIIKSNQIIGDCINKVNDENNIEKVESKKIKAIQTLKFRISTFFNNSQGKAKHPTNGRPIKGIKERLTGKDGQIRNNLMGKRVEFSARTVIGPDPNLCFGELGVPPYVAKELTFPEIVTKFNKDYLLNLVNTNKANFVIKNKGETKINLKYAMFRKGTELLYEDIIIRNDKEIEIINDNVKLKHGDKLKRCGKILSPLEKNDIIIRNGKIVEITDNFILKNTDKIKRGNIYLSPLDILKYPTQKRINLEYGDIVHRHLKNGDIVLLNRQPTLHKGSMLAKSIRIIEGKTFRMNLATTKTFNADFDGDEMNIHAPQSFESRAELKYLSTTKNNIISPQASKPNIAIVQDSLLGSYLMTKNNFNIEKSQFFDICMHGTINNDILWNPKKIETIKEVLKSKNKPINIYNGKSLFSLLLPDDFIYENKNTGTPEEPIIKIYKGVLYEGVLNKDVLGASHNSIIKVLNKEYGVNIASEFISNIQFITNKWLLINGFSVGLSDCLITSPKNVQKINDKIYKCYVEANGISNTTKDASIKEIRISASLNKAKDMGMKIAKDSMKKNNNILSTVYSGSKGDFFNISQLTGLLGQQNLLGKRVKRTLNNGTRTLCHYNFENNKEIEYESLGFIKSSFIGGLNPKEYYFHAMSGREGICDTAMGTAKSGYIQRRIVKLCEDIQIKYDGTVRDSEGKIYQLNYGNNGYDPTLTVKVNKKQQPCNISRIASKLNLQYENKNSVNRKDLIKQINKKTGCKRLYSNWCLNELLQRLDSLNIE